MAVYLSKMAATMIGSMEIEEQILSGEQEQRLTFREAIQFW